MEEFDAFWARLKEIILRSHCSRSFVESLNPDSRLLGVVEQPRLLNMVLEIESTYGLSFSEEDPLLDILRTPKTLYSYVSQRIRKTDNG